MSNFIVPEVWREVDFSGFVPTSTLPPIMQFSSSTLLLIFTILYFFSRTKENFLKQPLIYTFNLRANRRIFCRNIILTPHVFISCFFIPNFEKIAKIACASKNQLIKLELLYKDAYLQFYFTRRFWQKNVIYFSSKFIELMHRQQNLAIGKYLNLQWNGKIVENIPIEYY